jgi:hypothetical protein
LQTPPEGGAGHSRGRQITLRRLEIRMAKRLNKVMGRSGQVFPDRYHAHILKTPTEVAHALA